MQAAGRREKDELEIAAPGRADSTISPLRSLGLRIDDAGMLLVDVDHDFLDRLQHLAVVVVPGTKPSAARR